MQPSDMTSQQLRQAKSLIHTHDIPSAVINENPSTKTIRTTCPYCGVGCGVLATVTTDKDQSQTTEKSHIEVTVKGDPTHPANFGKLCSKGSALAQTLSTDRRITQPYYQNKAYAMHSPMNPAWHADPSDWNTVLNDIACKLTATIDQHGRDSVMFYVSGQLLTEDYYVANKFMKGFIGSNNIDSNSRLCMSSAVAGHKRAFGADLVTGSYTDFEDCDLLVLIGSNMAWCHPILFGRFLQAKQADPSKKLVVIDPRRTDSCEFADLHLPIAAGTDTHLYNGLLTYLEQQGCRDAQYVAHCTGIDDALQSAKVWNIAKVAEVTEVDAKKIEQFYQLVAAYDKTVSAFSMGVNQSSSGTDKVNAIINTHLLTGRVGKKGANPFSLTGQPNAMGGREVGALANLLAAHLDLGNSEHRDLVADFWQTPQPISDQVGVAACDVADAIMNGHIKAIWIMATNPVVSLPEADKFRDALAQCDLVIVSECSVDSDTVRCADIVLPALGWGEKSGTVTNSERRISRQRRLIDSVGESKPDWWILSQVAQRMGYVGFDYQNPSEIFNEHAQLTQYQNHSLTTNNANVKETNSNKVTKHFRVFNLAPHLNQLQASDNTYKVSAYQSTPILTQQQYDTMLPIQWGGAQIDVIRHQKANSNSLNNQMNTVDGALPSKVSFIAIEPPHNVGAITGYRRVKKTRMRIDNCNTDTTNTDTLYTDIDNLNSINNESGGSWSGGSESSKSNKISHGQTPNVQVFQPINLHLNLRLITGRLRDQWHTMTRTGLAATLNQQQSMPTVTLNPRDAQRLQVTDNNIVQLTAYHNPHNPHNPHSPDLTHQNTEQGVMAQVAVSLEMRKGDAFMPMHWSEAFASLSRVGTLIPTCVDPHSKQPELKNSAITVRPIRTQLLGRILVHPDWQDAVIMQLRTMTALNKEQQRQDKLASASHDCQLPPVPSLIWSLSKQENSILIHLSIIDESIKKQMLTQKFWQQFVDEVCNQNKQIDNQSGLNKNTLTKSDLSVVNHKATQQLRLIVNKDEAVLPSLESTTTVKPLMMAVYLAPNKTLLPSINWLDSCFNINQITDVPSVKWLLAGRPASGYVDPGPLVCSCMSVGENIIIDAIVNKGCVDAVAVGRSCKAGTNCGSCVGQINELIAAFA